MKDNNELNNHEMDDVKSQLFTFRNWIRLAVAVSLTVMIFCLVYFLSGRTLLSAANACFANVAFMLTFAFMSFFSNRGYFDGLLYGVSYISPFFRAFRGDYGGFVEDRKQKRLMNGETSLCFWPYALVMVLWVIPTIVLYIMVQQQISA